MNIKSIEMRGFMNYKDASVELPNSGVVLVTGHNGSGKSSLIEAVSMCMFGKTLRGSSPWVEGEAGAVYVDSDMANVSRMRSGSGRLTLSWDVVDPAARAAIHLELDGSPSNNPTYESTAKAQASLETTIGQHDIWRQTSVFSSADASYFTCATDAERKRLLEDILGLDRFDVALEKCREDLKKWSTNLAVANSSHERTGALLAAEKRRHSEAREQLIDLPQATAEATAKSDLAKAEQAKKTYDGDIKGLRHRVEEMRSAGRAIEHELKDVEREYSRLSSGQCPTCGQSTEQQAKKLRSKMNALASKRAEHNKSSEAIEGFISDIEELEEEYRVVTKRAANLEAKLVEAARTEKVRKRTQAILEEALAAIHRYEGEIRTLAKSIVDHEEKLAELEACERVLGTKGVRAHVFGKALAGIETAANAWLARIAGQNLRLRLKSYVEKKTGGISDAINLEVEGAGGGRGYRGSSGGERRRIDVALLLALADIAHAAHGKPPGTIFLDECMDALDSDGILAVAGVLEELAANRCVVVITHNEELAKTLHATKCLQVAGGRVIER